MPRIPDGFLNCIIYLYPSIGDAQKGEQAGGTGFLFGMPSEKVEGAWHLYAVTNSHVIQEASSTVIRLNTKEGETDILETDFIDWHEGPGKNDLAVCPLALNEEYHLYDWLGPDYVLMPDAIRENNIGPGDDVYMVGRFMSHEGKQRNLPSVRFGNIAMMPWEPIRNERGDLQESFVVEARSISGFSGSPVFVYIPMFSQRYDTKEGEKGGWAHEAGPWLLGIDWGHLPHHQAVIDEGGKAHPEGWRVQSNAGMVGVVPAWRLLELLFQEELKMGRGKRDRQLKEERKRHPPAEFDAKAKPFTSKDYKDALKKVSRPTRPSPPEQASSET